MMVNLGWGMRQTPCFVRYGVLVVLYLWGRWRGGGAGTKVSTLGVGLTLVGVETGEAGRLGGWEANFNFNPNL